MNAQLRPHSPRPTIPSRALFVWLGPALPYGAFLAIRSCRRRAGLAETWLLSEGLASGDPLASCLQQEGVRLSPIRRELFDSFPAGAHRTWALFRSLRSPAARANLARLAALHHLGGVYLDTDTLTLRTLVPLLELPGFSGSEHVSTPGAVWRSRNPARWIRSAALHLLRAGCWRVRVGLPVFRRLEPLYHHVATNAALGAPARHPLLAEAARRVARMPPVEARRPYGLGVHLLQSLTGNRTRPGWAVLAPRVFCPVAPEMSMHWFRRGSAADLPGLLSGETRVVHWYASTLRRHHGPRIEPGWIARERDRIAFARLAAPSLAPDLVAPTHTGVTPHPDATTQEVTHG